MAANTHSTDILSKNQLGQIFSCGCCDQYNLNYKNIYLIMSWKELDLFIKVLEHLSAKDFGHPSPAGNHAFLKQLDSKIGIGLSAQDANDIRQLFYEASLFRAAQNIIKQTCKKEKKEN